MLNPTCYSYHNPHLMKCQGCTVSRSCRDASRSRMDVRDLKEAEFEDMISDLSLICPRCNENVRAEGPNVYCGCASVPLPEQWFVTDKAPRSRSAPEQRRVS